MAEIKKYLHTLDIGNNKIINLLLNPLSTSDRTTVGSSLTTADEGYVCYDTDENVQYFWDGSTWIASGGGGSQTLQDVTDLGNTTTNNIQLLNAAETIYGAGGGILLDNGSRLREGTIVGYGGYKGIAQICSVGYELKWESGRLYIMNNGGTTIREVRYTFGITPGLNDDITVGYTVGSRWVLDNGDVYTCTDDTTNSATWVLTVNGVPTLQQVTDVDNNTTNDIILNGVNLGSSSAYSLNYWGNSAGNNNSGGNVNAFGDNAANGNTGNNINAIGLGTAYQNTGNDVNAFGIQAGYSNTFNQVNLFGRGAIATDNYQTVITKQTGLVSFNERLDLKYITSDRLHYLPDADGTFALSVNGVSAGTDGSITIPVGTGTVTGVTATSPITSSGGTAPVISTSMATNRLIGRYSASTGVMEEVSIGSGLTLTGAGVLNNTATPTPTGYYGAFQDNVTQTAAASNVGYAMIFRTIDLSNGISVVTNGTNLTRITFANTGVYNLQFSSQFQNTGNSLEDVTIWLRLMGSDVAGSSGFISIPARKSVSDYGHIIVSWNYLLSVVAGEYYELMWSTTNHTTVTMQFYAAGSPPPSTASVILTVTQQSGIMAGTGITGLGTSGNIQTGATQTLTTGTSGTAFNISSSGNTQTFNIPLASAASVTAGLISKTDYDTFNGKQPLATNLTSLSGLTYASASFVKMTAAGTFALDTNTYGSGTVTSVAALTLGTTGTDLSSTVATGTTTPVITLNVPDASATARGVVTTGAQTFGGLKSFSSIKVGTYTQYASISSVINTNGEVRAGGGFNLNSPSNTNNTFFGVKLNGSRAVALSIGGTDVLVADFVGSGASGNNILVTDGYNPTTGSGTIYGIRNSSTITPPSGSNSINYVYFGATPTITQGTFGTGTIRGFYYGPTVVSLNTSLHYAWQNTVGDCIFGSTSGSVGIGATTTINASAILQVTSTTKGVMFPNMTTIQKNAIANLAGNVVFDTTLGKLCVNTGSGWQTITSV